MFASGSSHSISGHFVLLHVNVPRHLILLYDSFESHCHTDKIKQSCQSLAMNIWGHPRYEFTQLATQQQSRYSNDCAVFVLENVRKILENQGHVFGHHFPREHFTRNSFRELWYLVPQISTMFNHRPARLEAPFKAPPVRLEAPLKAPPPARPFNPPPARPFKPSPASPDKKHRAESPDDSQSNTKTTAQRTTCEHDAIEALNLFYNRTNLSSIVEMKFNKSDELVGDFLDKELELIDSIQNRTKCTERAKARLETDPVVCGSCGIFCIDRNSVDLVPINSTLLDVFRWDSSNGVPPQGSVVLGQEIYDRDGHLLLLYPEGCSPEGVWCCKSCKRRVKNCKTKIKKAPEFSMINGVCFGRILSLPSLSFVEIMAISRSRLFSTTVQIVPKHKTKLHGTCISFPQNGPEVLCNTLPRSIEDISSMINIIFVGTEEDWINRRRDVLSKYYPHLYNTFRVRPDRVMQWLIFLKENHKEYRDIDISAFNCDALQQLSHSLFDSAHVCADAHLADLHNTATSDVANNRMEK